MQDSTNFVAKLSSPIVNDNTWSEISAVDMLVKKFCKALCSWARYGSKEIFFETMYFADATKTIWFNMSPCKSSFIYAGGKTESVYAAL